VRLCRSRFSCTAPSASPIPASASPANRSAAAPPTAANAPKPAVCPTIWYLRRRQVDLGDRRYLLSPQDLSGLEVLPDLVRAGVASLKIEGRLKSAEYVASITRVYRQALDKVLADLTGTAVPKFEAKTARYELEMSFSRGLYTGWFRGINNQELAHARFGTKRGVFLGEVTRVHQESVALSLAAPLKPGDGVVFDAGKPDEREQGGRVYQVETRPAPAGAPTETVLRFGHGDIDWRRVRAGQLVWKTNDPALDREVRSTFEGDQIRFTRAHHPRSPRSRRHPAHPVANDGLGHVVQLDSAVPLAPADKQPLTPERLREQLGRLGGTPFKLGDLHSLLEGDVIVPISELNRLRRETATALETLRAQPKRWQLTDSSARLSSLDSASALQLPTAAPPSRRS
jgi:putative protease